MQLIDAVKIGQRIKEVRLKNNLSQVLFADRLGLVQSAVSAIEKGERLPTTELLVSLVNEFGMTADWWLLGKESAPETVSDPQEQYTIKMPVRAMAGAGYPHCIDQLEPIGYITLDKSYDGPNIQVLQIRGNSMEPTIMDNSHVGIDVTDKEVISGQMYAVFIPYEGIVVKRIWIGPETVRIASDNPTAPDHELLTERINWETFVQGRVKWTVQRY